jgi:hypothetical protein
VFGSAPASPAPSPSEDPTGGLQVELVVDSAITVTKYGNLRTLAENKTKGTIRLHYVPGSDPWTWSGSGTLTSKTTTDPGISGCQTVRIEGEGTYDWVVREVVAEPGMAEGAVDVWMDAGPIDEMPDDITIGLCPEGTLPGTVNLWGNTFFGVFSAFYGAKGFHLDGLNNGDNGEVWVGGVELGELKWLGACELSLPEELLTSCTISALFTLRVVQP